MHHLIVLFRASRVATFCRCLPSSPGTTGYKACYQEVLKVVKGIIHQPLELKDDNVFYAFSYYYDRAVDAGLIGE